MLLLNFILFSVALVRNRFAAADTNSAFHIDATTSCGAVVLKQCWCLTENPCESDNQMATPDYVPNIDEKNILTETKIQDYIRNKSSSELNLSGLRFEGVEKNAFDNFINVTRLNLANNNISKLPEFLFAKLENLEHLSLAGNGIRGTRNVFAGLSNLKSLDISGNPLTDVLDDNCFFGLTKSCDILIRGVRGIKSIGANAFGNETSTPIQDFTDEDSSDEELEPKSIHARSASLYWGYPSDDHISSQSFRPQICIQENSVQRLDVLKMDENLTSNCSEVEFKYKTLFLGKLGISKFEKGWYRLQRNNQVPSTLSAIHLTGNNIVQVTSDVVNVLPAYITWLNLDENKIERLEKGTFEHKHIFSLDLNNNLIGEIEDNTFKMPKLYQLFLRENRLKDTKFAATLPSSIVSLHLDLNEITEISANSFSNLKELRYLNLNMNRITTVQSQSLRGAITLGQLLLSNNKIRTLEPGAFNDLKSLWQLHLQQNNISSLETEAFTGLVNIKLLNIANNKFTKIGNNTFDLPGLESLDMSNNNITAIEKGAVKNMSRLEKLDISKNPIKRLENGALFGLSKTRETQVHVAETPIEVIQGGLFDNV